MRRVVDQHQAARRHRRLDVVRGDAEQLAQHRQRVPRREVLDEVDLVGQLTEQLLRDISHTGVERAQLRGVEQRREGLAQLRVRLTVERGDRELLSGCRFEARCRGVPVLRRERGVLGEPAVGEHLLRQAGFGDDPDGVVVPDLLHHAVTVSRSSCVAQ
ncbi:hypothetical protein ACVDFE_36625 [Lentzea chajnantorensis]